MYSKRASAGNKINYAAARLCFLNSQLARKNNFEKRAPTSKKTTPLLANFLPRSFEFPLLVFLMPRKPHAYKES
jgi:hypothetical protein